MAIIRWRPMDLSSFFEDDFELPAIPGLNRLGQGLNIYETENTIVAEAALPGVPEDKIDVTVDEGVVRVTGSTTEKEEDKGKRRYYMSSLSSSYSYAFRLPEGLKNEEPTIELEDGVLKMVFPKSEKVPPKKLKVISKQSLRSGDLKKGVKGGEVELVGMRIKRGTRHPGRPRKKIRSVGKE